MLVRKAFCQAGYKGCCKQMYKHFRRHSGFTLIELMVVVVIIGIIASIALPLLSAAHTRAKDASTKANMNAFRTMVEIYSAMYTGSYPENVTAISTEPEMINSRLFKELRNPFTNKTGKGFSFDDESQSKIPGLITYDPYTLGGYAIYGYDHKIQRIQNKGTVFILTNS